MIFDPLQRKHDPSATGAILEKFHSADSGMLLDLVGGIADVDPAIDRDEAVMGN